MEHRAAAKAMLMSIVGKLNRASRNAFTLFELLVVLAILALAAGFVVPQVSGTPKDDTRAVVRFIRGTLDQGRTLAKLTRKDVLVQFEYDLIRINGGKEFSFPGDSGFRELVLAAGEENAASAEFFINRRGIAPSSLVRVETDDGLYSLLISPVLCEVQCRKGIADFEDFAK